MTHYLRNLFVYFENVLHPAAGSSDIQDKTKRKMKKQSSFHHVSPEHFNIRGEMSKKQDKTRRNPAP